MTLFKRQGGHFHPLPTIEKPSRLDFLTPYDEADWYKAVDAYKEHLKACEAGAIPIEQVSNHSETKEGAVYTLEQRQYFYTNDAWNQGYTALFAIPVNLTT
jgi:hypothetical protein